MRPVLNAKLLYSLYRKKMAVYGLVAWFLRFLFFGFVWVIGHCLVLLTFILYDAFSQFSLYSLLYFFSIIYVKKKNP